MEDQEKQNLPNLKICVDNTEEGELSESDDSNEEKSDIDVDEEDISDTTKPKEVEFNVRISNADSEEKTKLKNEVFTKKYENKDGNFVTGLDLTSKEALEKKEERAKRFGIEVQERPNLEADIKDLYASLGLKEDDFNRGERGVRPEAIHIRGTDHMSTKDVFRYFKEFAPGGIEWIDDASCNVVWADPTTAARAMLKMSNSYESIMEPKDEDKPTQKTDTKKTEDGDQAEKREEKMDVEEYDDDLDLLAEDEEEGKMEEEKKDQKKTDENTKEEKDDKNLTDDEKEENDKKEKNIRRKERKIAWPPGKWRLGLPSQKASQIFIRFATKADKKLPRAESRSKYYVKYGNPNYGGMKGLISNSRKSRYRQKTFEEELAEAKEAIEIQKDAREAEERGDIFEDREEPHFKNVSPLKRKRGGSGSEGEDMDMEAELQELLGPPVRKQRSMRMYADEEEEKRNTKKRLGVSSGIMTVVAGNNRPAGKVKDARELIQRGAIRSGLMMDREPASLVSSSRRGDLRLRVQASPSVSGSDEESELEEDEESSKSDDSASSSSEEEYSRSSRPSEIRSSRHSDSRSSRPSEIRSSRHSDSRSSRHSDSRSSRHSDSRSSRQSDSRSSRPSVMSRLGPAGQESDSESDDSDKEFTSRLHLGQSGKDLRSRLGSRKNNDNKKYPSMRIEVFD